MTKPTIKEIQTITARELDISFAEIVGKSRCKGFVYARHIAIYLIRKHLNKSFPEIAFRFSRRDHTSILYAYNKVAERLGDYCDDIKRIEERLQLTTNPPTKI